jgi:transcription antitermination factor NusA-like protein
MVNTIDMQDMRYLNLFEKIMRVRTRFCFRYNDSIVFCVPKPLMAKAIGEGGKNIKKMSGILDKKIKVVVAPQGIHDVNVFIKAVVSPVTFRNLEVKDNEVIVTGGTNKAALIGRNKRRLFEMQKVVKDFFGKDFRVI